MCAIRLWSLHPSLLDRAALVSCWREGLLAKAVLLGKTKGYTNHPQLERFRAGGLANYLGHIAEEAQRRGYDFNFSKVCVNDLRTAHRSMTVTTGQLAYELAHLRHKCRFRAPVWTLPDEPTAHPIFTVVPGPIEPWERVKEHAHA